MRMRVVFGAIAAAAPATACGGEEARRSTDSAAVSAGASVATGAMAATACELLTAGEVAGLLRVPVVYIDSINSGFNETIKVDFCFWYVAKGGSDGIMIKLWRSGTADEVLVRFAAARIDADFQGAPESVEGIGDEALYGVYPDRTGGTIVFRKGASAVTILGSISRETLIFAAKATLMRL